MAFSTALWPATLILCWFHPVTWTTVFCPPAAFASRRHLCTAPMRSQLQITLARHSFFISTNQFGLSAGVPWWKTHQPAPLSFAESHGPPCFSPSFEMLVLNQPAKCSVLAKTPRSTAGQRLHYHRKGRHQPRRKPPQPRTSRNRPSHNGTRGLR